MKDSTKNRKHLPLPIPTGIEMHVHALEQVKWTLIERLATGSYEGRWRQDIDLQFAAKLGRLIQELRANAMEDTHKISDKAMTMLSEFGVKEVSDAMSPIFTTNNKDKLKASQDMASAIINQLLSLQKYPIL